MAKLVVRLDFGATGIRKGENLSILTIEIKFSSDQKQLSDAVLSRIVDTDHLTKRYTSKAISTR